MQQALPLMSPGHSFLDKALATLTHASRNLWTISAFRHTLIKQLLAA